MTRVLATLALLALLDAATASAQTLGAAFVAVDPLGYPMQVFQTPTLFTGAVYEFDTTDLQPSSSTDTVLSIRSYGTVDATTIAGADGVDCPGTPYSILRSCVRFTAPSTWKYWIWLRSWSTSSRGTADVRYRSCPATGSCTAAWTTLGNDLSVGGLSQMGSAIGTAATNVHFETTELPGSRRNGWSSAHVILFAEGSGADKSWRLRPNAPPGTPLPLPGQTGSHRRGIEGQAEFSGSAAYVWGSTTPAVVISGPLSAYASGPHRLFRNDWLVNGSAVDVDGDELGYDLERVLKTCDRTTSPTENFIACSSLPGCWGSPSCAASLRDTDGDGLRDDVELLGVSLQYYGITTPPYVRLPRMGSNPARYDVFVQVDYPGSMGPNGCQRSDTEWAAAPRSSGGPIPAERAADVFRNTTAHANRDGTPGMFFHFDVGRQPPMMTTAFPTALDDTRWGSFDEGGGTPICDSTVGNQFGYPEGVQDYVRWIFRYAFYSAAGAQTSGRGSATDAASTLAHELAHQGGLAHGGPAAAREQTEGKPNYWSRINYLYQDVGSRDLSGPNRTLVSFSSGQFAAFPLRPRAVLEECPLGTSSSSLALINLETPWAGTVTDTEPTNGCPDVDWDLDGTIAPTGTPVSAPLGAIGGRGARRTELTPGHADGDAFGRLSGGALVTFGDALTWIKIVPDATDSPRATAYLNYSMTCSESPAPPPGDAFPPCWSPGGAHDETRQLQRSGAVPIAPTALDAADVTFDATYAGALIVYVEGGNLYSGMLLRNVATHWTSYWDFGPLGGTSSLPADPESHVPAVARFGDSPYQLLLVYRLASGGLASRVATVAFSGVPTVSWTTESSISGVPGSLQGSAALGTLTSYGSPPISGVVMFFSNAPTAVTSQLYTWTRTAASATWTARSAPASANFGLRSKPEIAQAPYAGGQNRLYAVWTGSDLASGANSRSYVMQTDYNTWTWRGQGGGPAQYNGSFSPEPSQIAWDGRPTASPPSLRGTFSVWRDCSTMMGGTTMCRAPTTCVSRDMLGTENDQCVNLTTGTAQADEFFFPFADGIPAVEMRDYDDWPSLRYFYCSSIRTAQTSGGVDPTPLPLRDGAGPCGTAPVYP